MKRIMTILVLSTAIFSLANGQWYYKKYQVASLEDLTPGEIDLALHDANYLAAGCAIWAGAGVGIYFVGRSTVRNGLDEDATFLEQLLGNEVVGYGTMGLGIASVAGGLIGTLVGVTRIGMIKRSGRRTPGPQGSLNVSPVMILNQYSGTATPGAMLSVRF